jgi:hypothetical protein
VDGGKLSESDYLQDLTVDGDIKMDITCIEWEGWPGLTWLWIQWPASYCESRSKALGPNNGGEIPE